MWPPDPLPESGLTLTTQAEEAFRKKYFTDIVQDAITHNFYPGHLRFYHISPEFRGIYCYSSEKGWALVLQGMDPTKGPYVEVKYAFVYPDQRKKGFFRSVHNELLRLKLRICVCTKTKEMVRTLHALGYELQGRSLNNRELNFLYTQHLKPHIQTGSSIIPLQKSSSGKGGTTGGTKT